MEKFIRDGNVAVIYSPGYGAGWYTWNNVTYGHELVFDPMLVDMILNNEKDKFETYIAMRYPEMYNTGFDDLAVKWLPVGTVFQIHEYDGNESIEIQKDMDWIVA
jgi:hypothetical protein